MQLELPDVSVDALNHIQNTEHSIFTMQSFISGDTNNGNWGRRYNGELVLFDWERFGLGCPTIDLAPLVSGMGSIDAFEAIIEQYSKVDSYNLPTDPLTNLIVAKTWIAVEVINILVSRDNPQKPKYLEWFNNTLPDWLYKMGNAL
ncbi:Predicted choline kinase involved in LPS biosynthesis (fragment) [Vibrio nigripulchritudo MADA3029]|uniref:phosphotransferase family protein n=1 Tax=Vibrio nigripulchritudo TaxID=28173 RepID=UPI0003B1801A